MFKGHRKSSDIFGNVWKSLENCWKSSEVGGTFSEILVMMRRKSHAFHSEKVDRYTRCNRVVVAAIPLHDCIVHAADCYDVNQVD